ncbi:MAG: 50S ribosomal protein L10 [Candidatus Levybacteria bacterium RIFCSPHIGHO2_02_FULL_40_18]|nr:MAG: 50S ribosomal protein L10 [Candidatus Levybacteria bacterium RIFCSPHIGHO2_01_FULL_40_58]OGH26655.1 MAG: 50S ribosomal protein L10 [Candidatus Levybacteria bacterium RIFCSPHIGHO2_02_FULL_40_18]OGH31184.1 MAG: 50S ribosomal protein L10 [Candidatus Levybacteria bacterium RIFCSPHIGHO2_12_FULL_40_31]OGH39866.1 MAG: 50S ribosomal protein L10 [Candidatus Levybacteria bacterium RIFCSPLOWO2_01_FULL_40_64]OGH48890.1 MAG: 50S ribosomal protein L10 [Candidatus Levybacteria bacterium RIFCSPLOWO2_02_
MPSQRNIQLLEELKQKVDKAAALFFVDYSGLTHRQLEEVRRELKDNDSEIGIIKNTLMNLALQEKKIDAKDRLQGPFATLFSYEDPIKTVRVLAAFIKKYGLPKIKFGWFENSIIDETMITKLATLPSREILVAKLLGTLNAPISGLVYTLSGNIQKLAMVLKAVESKKQPAS